jgi:hypothetical protein
MMQISKINDRWYHFSFLKSLFFILTVYWVVKLNYYLIIITTTSEQGH